VHDDRRPRIGIYANIKSGLYGGIEQFIIGLVHGLGRLTDGDEHYVVITNPRDPDWLKPYMGQNQTIAIARRVQEAETLESTEATANAEQNVRANLRKLWHTVPTPVRAGLFAARRFIPELRDRAALGDAARIPLSDGVLESLDLDLVLFAYQRFVRTSLPFVYCPHDLQHLHLRQLFTKEELRNRRAYYPFGCRQASAVVAPSNWVREDVVAQFETPSDRAYCIRHSSPTEAYDEVPPDVIEEVTRKHLLPPVFALFPGQTWPHKNHVRLVQAINLIRQRSGRDIHVVCSGKQNDYFPTIEREMGELGVNDLFHFVGFVSPTELRALYRLADFVVYPSLFEGGGFPLLEAFREDVAITCSSVTCLPEYGGDAVLPFEPTRVESIADAIERMSLDITLKEDLRRKGRLRIRSFSWDLAARSYRAVFRKAIGLTLTDEDCALLHASNTGAPQSIWNCSVTAA
jgi:glycosyltransferase involved in cell wall biosynthesis